MEDYITNKSILLSLEATPYPNKEMCEQAGEYGKKVFNDKEIKDIKMDWLEDNTVYNYIHILDSCH